MGKPIDCTVRFVTPAFLGGADQSGQWRTPPFKALLRQWWRVAEVRGRAPDLTKLHDREGELFGRAADEGTTASHVKMRLDWRGGTMGKEQWARLRFDSVAHPEVSQRPGVALYLGYGPIGVGNKLNRNSAVAPDQPRDLKLGVPTTDKPRFQEVLRLAHAFGTLGSRSRNGWGSLHFDSGGLASAELNALLDPANPEGRAWLGTYARDWRAALSGDWCHAVGKDHKGLLLWRTPACGQWEQVLKLLAEVKITFRTQFHFKGGGNHATLCDRQVLAYPITRHALNASGWDRSANQVMFKIHRTGGSCVGTAVHLPHGLPEDLKAPLQETDKAGLRRREEEVWSKVHKTLDDKLTRLP